MLLIPDARRRVTLPSTFKAGQPVDLEPQEDGTFRLVPMVAVPEHQLWAWRPEVQAAVARSFNEPSISINSPEGQAFLKKLAQ
jgi:hypothetical protein